MHSDSENTRPLPFPARFVPRNAKIREIIMAEAEEARGSLVPYDWQSTLNIAQFQ